MASKPDIYKRTPAVEVSADGIPKLIGVDISKPVQELDSNEFFCYLLYAALQVPEFVSMVRYVGISKVTEVMSGADMQVGDSWEVH